MNNKILEQAQAFKEQIQHRQSSAQYMPEHVKMGIKPIPRNPGESLAPNWYNNTRTGVPRIPHQNPNQVITYDEVPLVAPDPAPYYGDQHYQPQQSYQPQQYQEPYQEPYQETYQEQQAQFIQPPPVANPGPLEPGNYCLIFKGKIIKTTSYLSELEEYIEYICLSEESPYPQLDASQLMVMKRLILKLGAIVHE